LLLASFEVLTAVLMEVQVFGCFILCLLVHSYRHYKRSVFAYLEGKTIHRNVGNSSPVAKSMKT